MVTIVHSTQPTAAVVPKESCHALRLEGMPVLRASQFQLSSLELLTAARGSFNSNFQEHL